MVCCVVLVADSRCQHLVLRARARSLQQQPVSLAAGGGRSPDGLARVAAPVQLLTDRSLSCLGREVQPTLADGFFCTAGIFRAWQ